MFFRVCGAIYWVPYETRCSGLGFKRVSRREALESVVNTVVLGQRGYVRAVADALYSRQPIRLAIKGWRRRWILPYLSELIPEARHVPQASIRKPIGKWAWLKCGFWFLALLSFYRMASDRGLAITVLYGNEILIEFEMQEQEKRERSSRA